MYDVIEISRDEFENLSKDLMHQISCKVKEVLHKARADKIDQVIYIGGSSKMPMIRKALNELFPKSEHYCGADSEYTAAAGACIHALQLREDKI